MAETDNNWNTGSRRVNMKIWGGVPSFYENLSKHQISCIYYELRVFKKKNMDKMGKSVIITFGTI